MKRERMVSLFWMLVTAFVMFFGQWYVTDFNRRFEEAECYRSYFMGYVYKDADLPSSFDNPQERKQGTHLCLLSVKGLYSSDKFLFQYVGLLPFYLLAGYFIGKRLAR